MTRFLPEKELHKPDLSIGGFELWVHGCEFPKSDDYWDGNWIVVTACCTTPFAIVQTEGSIYAFRNLIAG
ncbi:hypothetical protein [Candidatus Neptunochlamydia vexilliferae]|uniref:WapI family immunity protein n=1 Tax=Candidatus Neptunichlamydia vexilliferae TaxID=1651774 RepID=UPI001890BE81|nr:hypothetical protein [Candidatus Neptunochlamydia vexilliferae]